jgi:hypothetical protein
VASLLLLEALVLRALARDRDERTPTAGQMQNALVDGSQIYARSRVNYEAMVRANAAGTKAFAKATAHIVKRLTNAAGKRLEAAVLHGREGWGALSAVSGSGTTRTWTITDAETGETLTALTDFCEALD